MKHFISLEEFLLLQDPDYKNPTRSAHNMMISPEMWVKYYNCAKANWTTFKDPETTFLNAEVITLIPGHCGRENSRRIVKKIDGLYFVLGFNSDSQDGQSMVPISQWWLHITHPSLSPFRRGYGWDR